MGEHESGASKFTYFLAGIGFGAALALLFAPRTGEETRGLIGAKATQGKEYVAAKSKEMREQAEQFVEKAKDMVAQQKEQLSAALEAGKQAYHEEKAKTQTP
jgi:gas vesicle protein